LGDSITQDGNPEQRKNIQHASKSYYKGVKGGQDPSCKERLKRISCSKQTLTKNELPPVTFPIKLVTHITAKIAYQRRFGFCSRTCNAKPLSG
jgi:hypothetical protein